MNLKKTILILSLLPLLTKTCINGDPNCSRCAGDKCTLCYNSYPSTPGICTQISIKVENCISYKSPTQCETCNFGYKANSDGKCQKIAKENCLKLDLNGNCSICNNARIPEEGVCESDGNRCDLANCAVCEVKGGLERCLICEKGLTLFPEVDEDVLEFKCVSQTGAGMGCRETLVGDRDSCLECLPNFFYVYGKCLSANYDNIVLDYVNYERVLKIFGVLISFLLF